MNDVDVDEPVVQRCPCLSKSCRKLYKSLGIHLEVHDFVFFVRGKREGTIYALYYELRSAIVLSGFAIKNGTRCRYTSSL